MADQSGVIIREIEFDPERRDYTMTHRVSANGLLLTATGKIVLQRRPDDADGAPGMLGLFGAVQEIGQNLDETILETGLRAMVQGLGIRLDPLQAELLGALEVIQQDAEPAVMGISARYFWPVIGTPVMCREGRIETFRSGAEIMAQENLTKATEWAVARAMMRGLIPT